MITDEVKNRYAIELARQPNDALKAALIVCNNNLGLALELMTDVQEDFTFSDRQRVAVEEAGAENFLPSKELVVHEIINLGRSIKDVPDLRLRAYRLAAEMMGWIEKGTGTNVNVQNNITENRVMVVTRHSDPAGWEVSASRQQSKLIEDATAIHRSS